MNQNLYAEFRMNDYQFFNFFFTSVSVDLNFIYFAMQQLKMAASFIQGN